MEEINVKSIDDGYGDGKCSSSSKLIRIPNAYADYRPMPKNNIEDIGFVDNDKHYNPLLEYISYKGREGHFIIGETALRQSMDINWYGGDEKHKDYGFPVLLKTFLGILADEEHSNVDLLVMGLPCNKDTRQRVHTLESIVLNHNHRMEIVLADNSVLKRDVVVNNLIVKKQPFGSFCDLLLDNNGNVTNVDLANSFSVVVDIGSRTLNIYGINRMEEVNDLIHTTNNGMYTSYMRVGSFIKSRMGFEVPTGKLPLIVKEGKFQSYNLNEVISRSNELLANEIKKIMDTILVNSYGYISHIIFTGGGAEVLKENLQHMFNKYNPIFLDRYSTARGLRKYGLLKAKKMNFEKSRVGYERT